MTTQASEGLNQHSWKLAEMGLIGALRPIPPEFTITLQFEGESRIYGASACNRYFGKCHRDGSQLRFQHIGATRMMCSEPAMALERDYFAALEHVETYQLQADRLALYYDQGKSLLIFRNGVAS
jgi:heat shock protein HslJ